MVLFEFYFKLLVVRLEWFHRNKINTKIKSKKGSVSIANKKKLVSFYFEYFSKDEIQVFLTLNTKKEL